MPGARRPLPLAAPFVPAEKTGLRYRLVSSVKEDSEQRDRLAWVTVPCQLVDCDRPGTWRKGTVGSSGETWNMAVLGHFLW